MVVIRSELFDNDTFQNKKNIPMFNDTIHRRIFCIADDIEYQLVEKIMLIILYHPVKWIIGYK